MQEQITHARSMSLAIMLLEQSIRRREYPSDKDLKQERRDTLPFNGDNEELPPLAWTLVWHDTYSNSLVIPFDIHLCGYVMWDAARLEHTGAKEVLARQWKDRWGNVDPRTRL